MASNIGRQVSAIMLFAWILLGTTLVSLTACETMDCSNIATTGCGGGGMAAFYDPYDYRPTRD